MKFLEIFDETKFFHAKQRTVTMNKDSVVWPAKRYGCGNLDIIWATLRYRRKV